MHIYMSLSNLRVYQPYQFWAKLISNFDGGEGGFFLQYSLGLENLTFGGKYSLNREINENWFLAKGFIHAIAEGNDCDDF